MTSMQVEVGKKYRHYKGGEYVVVAVGLHSETQEKVVVYQAQYSDPNFGDNAVWVRPYNMFVETVLFEGSTVPRFSLIS
jgi:hypothetical protein